MKMNLAFALLLLAAAKLPSAAAEDTQAPVLTAQEPGHAYVLTTSAKYLGLYWINSPVDPRTPGIYELVKAELNHDEPPWWICMTTLNRVGDAPEPMLKVGGTTRPFEEFLRDNFECSLPE